MNNVTKGKPTKDANIIRQCIKNDFKLMINEALEALDKVLAQRELDLNLWANKEQDEFYKIFGQRGECLVNVNMPVRGKTHIINISARELMIDCVRRLKWIRAQLTVESFINKINDEKTFCASVTSGLEKNYKIEIGVNFTGRKNNGTRKCANVMGVDSRVATLCHEMSHFDKHYVDPMLGGMGTSDYDVDGKKHSTRELDKWSIQEHRLGADKLVKTGDSNVFDNAYNIERYFELEL